MSEQQTRTYRSKRTVEAVQRDGSPEVDDVIIEKLGRVERLTDSNGDTQLLVTGMLGSTYKVPLGSWLLKEWGDWKIRHDKEFRQEFEVPDLLSAEKKREAGQ